MIKYFLGICFVVLFQQSYAQCISGNCDNGFGKMQWRDGIYEGELLANTPHGKGKWSYYYQRGKQVDSIVEEGIFFAGILFKGTENTMATWYRIDAGGQADAPSIFFNNQKFYRSVYPDKRDIVVDYAKSKNWTGKTDKKGMPTGDGEIRIGEVKLSLTIKEGRVLAIKNVIHYNSPFFSTSYTLTRISLTELNLINELTYEVKKNDKKHQELTLSIVMPLTLACLKLPKDGPVIAVYADGNKYEGFFAQHQPNGFGVFQNATNGYVDSGYFRFGQLHGWGQRKFSTAQIDTGYFRNGGFLYGAFTSDTGKTWQSFPKCLSGNCQNGMSKVNYSRQARGTYIYEGEMMSGKPHGSGSLQYKSGNDYLSKTGNFAMGELQGYAIIESNIGPVKMMRGYFQHDSLTHGLIHYKQSNVQFSSIGQQPGSKGYDLEMQPLVWEQLNSPRVYGSGILQTNKGAIVKGEFNAFNTLMDGVYTGADGYQLQFGDRNRNHLLAVGLGGQQELNMSFDNLDFVVSTYRQRKIEQQEQAAARRAALEAEIKQQRRMDSLMRIKGNWSVTSHNEICQLCNGKGTVGNATLGGDIDYISKVYDRWGNLVSSRFATIEGIGPKRGRRVTCSQCYGKGVVSIQDKKYIGPTK